MAFPWGATKLDGTLTKDLPTIVHHSDLAKYNETVSLRSTKVQDELHKVAESHSMAIMNSPRTESQFLAWLAKLTGAKRVIEVGVFLGVTTLTLAQALPEDGKILALDVSEEFTSVGAKYWKDAGVAHKVELILKPAVETLRARSENPAELNSYDFAFIDADKPNYDHYYEYCLKLVKVGGVIVVDNTFWHGRVLDKDDHSPETQSIRELNEKIHNDQRVDISMLSIADGVTHITSQKKSFTSI